jgi:hypothetical protein
MVLQEGDYCIHNPSKYSVSNDLLRKDIDVHVNKHERLSNITLKHRETMILLLFYNSQSL